MQPEFTAKTNKVYFFQMGYSIFNRFQSRHFCVPRCSSILFFAWLCFYFCFLFFLLACSFLELKGLAWGQKKKKTMHCVQTAFCLRTTRISYKNSMCWLFQRMCSVMQFYTFATHIPSLKRWLEEARTLFLGFGLSYVNQGRLMSVDR